MKTRLFKKESLFSNDVIALILRLILATIFIAHGSQKVFGLFGGYGLEGTTFWMHSQLGIPFIFAYLACFLEFFAGVGLLIGWCSRFFGLFIVIDMLVAIATAHHGFFSPKGIEFPLTLIVVAITVIITGSGKYSIGTLFKK